MAITMGCGGSGGDDASSGGGSSGQPATSAPTLEVFQASLDAIDPGAPGQVMTIDASAAAIDPDRNAVGALSVLGGTFVDGALASAQVEWVVYPRDDGTLQRVSTAPGVGVPVPIRVSSEDRALPFCDAVVANEIADPSQARVAYGVGDGTCAGPLDWRVVELSDDVLTAPRALPGEPLESLVDPRTGAHLGWLVLTDGSLDRLDSDLAVVSAGMVTGVQLGEVLGATDDGTLFLELDQRLYAYDPGAAELRDFRFELVSDCSCRSRFASGRAEGFFIDGGELHRADPRRGRISRVEAPDDALRDPDASDFVVLGARHVAWSYVADADGDGSTTGDRERVIRILGRDGSGGRTFDRYVPHATPLPALSGFVAAASDEWLFYNRVTADDPTPTSFAARLEGGSYSFSSPALWVGRSTTPDAIPGREGPLARVFRLSGLRDHPDLGANFRLRLYSVDPERPRVRDEDGDLVYVEDVDLGQLDSDVQFAYVPPGFGPGRVGVVLTDDGSGRLRSDVFHLQERTTSSILRLTGTLDRDEVPGHAF